MGSGKTEVERVNMRTMERAHEHYSNYARYFCGVGLMWGIFTICFTIINIIVFIQPQWLGDSEDSPGIGFFGLYQYCELSTSAGLFCIGALDEFSDILSDAFKAATVFIGVSCLFMFLCVLALPLFLCVKAGLMFGICGSFQLASGLLMFLGCVIYPVGWDDPAIRRICGQDSDRYERASCEIRWAYILAIIGIFDVLILAVLAFVLATRVAPKPRDYLLNGGISKSDVLETESKPSLLIQPVLAVPEVHQSELSHPSTTRRSRHSNKGDFSL